MSRESAKAFLERMKTDPEFAAQVIRCKSKEERHQVAAAAGFTFTGAELTALREELSDSDLEQVAGGCGMDGFCASEWKEFCRAAGETNFKCQKQCNNGMEITLPEN